MNSIIKQLTTTESSHTSDWQQALAHAVRQPEELLRLLDLPLELLPGAIRAAEDFPLCVPHSYLARMEKGNPADPLLRQVLPIGAECLSVEGFDIDPVGDTQALAAPGLLHKYHGRVLLTTTGACAIHCRYCFRRHYPYTESFSGASIGAFDQASKNTLTAQSKWHAAMEYIRKNKEIHEVILSGGDPLCLGTPQLEHLVRQISTIPHVTRLRFHSRTPIVLPERIDNKFISWLNSLELETIMVVHCNHPNELDQAVIDALSRLEQTGMTMLNQSVLLRGVNDHVGTLTRLSERLFSARIMPYYLHQLDRVQGAAHFEVTENESRKLLDSLREKLPGYLVPRLVIECAGEMSKTPL